MQILVYIEELESGETKRTDEKTDKNETIKYKHNRTNKQNQFLNIFNYVDKCHA